MIKYIAYCRKSTDEKTKQVLSIDQQLVELKEFAQKEKLEVVDYLIEAKTAKTPGRKTFNHLIKLIEKGCANGILAWHPDRLARNSVDGGKIIYLLDTGKLQSLKFPTFWFENTPQGKFFLSISFGQSKYYIDNLSENTKRGLRHKLRCGVWPGQAPLGYINEPKLKTIEVDPEKSKIVKKAFQLFANGGCSFAEIARFLYKHGITAKSGKPHKVDSVKNMLTNKFYIGIMKYTGEYYQGSHKLFISKKLFDQAQKKVIKIEKPRKEGHHFAFTGLARCGECGAAITAEIQTKFYPTTRGKVDYIYYHCTKKIKPCFQKGYLREEALEQRLRKFVTKAGLHPGWRKYFENWMKRDEKKDKKNTEKELGNLKDEIKVTDQKLNRLLDAYLDQVIEPKIYKEKKNELFEEKLRLQEKMTKIQKDGCSWLEPMREFVESALSAHKIARTKNNRDELCSIAKKVGSNYLIKNRLLTAGLAFPFRALAAGGGTASAPPNSASISLLAPAVGLEPTTNRLTGGRSTIELRRNIKDLFCCLCQLYQLFI